MNEEFLSWLPALCSVDLNETVTATLIVDILDSLQALELVDALSERGWEDYDKIQSMTLADAEELWGALHELR